MLIEASTSNRYHKLAQVHRYHRLAQIMQNFRFTHTNFFRFTHTLLHQVDTIHKVYNYFIRFQKNQLLYKYTGILCTYIFMMWILFPCSVAALMCAAAILLFQTAKQTRLQKVCTKCIWWCCRPSFLCDVQMCYIRDLLSMHLFLRFGSLVLCLWFLWKLHYFHSNCSTPLVQFRILECGVKGWCIDWVKMWSLIWNTGLFLLVTVVEIFFYKIVCHFIGNICC